jgi:hypothetical protein
MPDVHAVSYYYGELPVYMRLNLGTFTPETYRIQGSKGLLEVAGNTIVFTPQAGRDMSPSYYAQSFPRALREAYQKQWWEENGERVAKDAISESVTIRGPGVDSLRVHLQNFYDGVRSRKPVVEDAVFGHHAALACHMANESFFRKEAVWWDEASKTMKS